jgi:transcriptional regulator with XRE-family HTH domain
MASKRVETEDVYEQCAMETLRALRGQRSQVAFARRLGYRANPITDWENGRRSPTITETLRAASIAGIDAGPAFNRLITNSQSSSCAPTTRDEIAAWLDALRGSTSNADLSRRSGLSRHSVSRFLSGKSEPRLPDFLRLLDAASTRFEYFIDALVGIGNVPSLKRRYQRMEAARRLALDHPWSEAVLRVLETKGYCNRRTNTVHYVARKLGLPRDDAQVVLQALLRAGLVLKKGRSLAVAANLSVDTGNDPERLRALRRHWGRVAQARLEDPNGSDWFAYNVIAVSKSDSERIEQLLRAAYREVRTIVAHSKPEEVAALLTIQMVRW